jgi:PAS domain-containing protein
MTKNLIEEANYLRTVLDASPFPVFIMDWDARIVDANRAARELIGNDPNLALQRPCGEVLHCRNLKEATGKCGKTPFCEDCVIRNSVNKAIKGNRVVRERSRLELSVDGQAQTIHVLTTASPFLYEGTLYALVILEDITELVQLQRILPICANCKRIRNDQHYWEQVESYLSKHTEIRFSHGICPDCIQKLYPELAGS